MREIIGNTTATPNPRPDWNQTDETKADYIKNKPELENYVKNTDLIGRVYGPTYGLVYQDMNQAKPIYALAHGELTLGNNNSRIEAQRDLNAIRNKDLSYAMVVGLTMNKNTLSDEQKASAQEWLGLPDKYIVRSQPSSGIRLYGSNNVKPQTHFDLTSNGLMVFNQNNIITVPFGDIPDKFTLSEEQKAKWTDWLGVTDKLGDINTALEAILGV